jgi:hypothetical protein
MPGALRRALRRPARTLLKFEPTSEGQWGSADHKHAFTITHIFDGAEGANISPDPFFVVHVSQLDGSYRRRTGRRFKTFEEAVHRCSIYTREARRQVAYHEAGHAVTAYLLGFTGVWIEMDDGRNRAITRHDMLPSILTVAGGDRAVLARYQYEELMYFVAGLVAEEKIAGYPGNHIEEDTAGRLCIEWEAVRAARLEAGLPICGHSDCTIPFDADVDDDVVDTHAGPDSNDDAGCGAGRRRRVTEADVAAIIKRAEDETFDLLKANWRTVLRVVNALCKRDKITSTGFDVLMRASPKSAGKHHRLKRKLVGSSGLQAGEHITFELAPAPDLGSSSTTPPLVVMGQEIGQAWKAADHSYAFTITREFNVDVSFCPFFVAHASRLDGSKKDQIGHNFKTFEAAVRYCANFTRNFRRRIACHEAGHAVVGWLLGFSGIWIEMCARGDYRSVVWYTEAAYTVLANGEHAARDWYKSLLFSVAGLVAEVRIAGYRR